MPFTIRNTLIAGCFAALTAAQTAVTGTAYQTPTTESIAIASSYADSGDTESGYSAAASSTAYAAGATYTPSTLIVTTYTPVTTRTGYETSSDGSVDTYSAIGVSSVVTSVTAVPYPTASSVYSYPYYGSTGYMPSGSGVMPTGNGTSPYPPFYTNPSSNEAAEGPIGRVLVWSAVMGAAVIFAVGM